MTPARPHREQLLTLTEAAALVKVHRHQLWRWVRDGQGPPSERQAVPYMFDRDKLRSWHVEQRALLTEYRRAQKSQQVSK